eukprot:1145039-Pelagomonas_calceolata.AAC.5
MEQKLDRRGSSRGEHFHELLQRARGANLCFSSGPFTSSNQLALHVFPLTLTHMLPDVYAKDGNTLLLIGHLCSRKSNKIVAEMGEVLTLWINKIVGKDREHMPCIIVLPFECLIETQDKIEYTSVACDLSILKDRKVIHKQCIHPRISQFLIKSSSRLLSMDYRA